MSNKAFAADVLTSIASDPGSCDSDRIQATSNLMVLSQRDDSLSLTQRWYQVGTQDLAVFFLKAALAGLPAILLYVFVYIAIMIFTQIVPTLMGLQ